MLLFILFFTWSHCFKKETRSIRCFNLWKPSINNFSSSDGLRHLLHLKIPGMDTSIFIFFLFAFFKSSQLELVFSSFLSCSFLLESMSESNSYSPSSQIDCKLLLSSESESLSLSGSSCLRVQSYEIKNHSKSFAFKSKQRILKAA